MNNEETNLLNIVHEDKTSAGFLGRRIVASSEFSKEILLQIYYFVFG